MPVVKYNPSRETFDEVRAACEAACQEAVGSKLQDAFNPSDLHCTDVHFCVDRDGVSWWLCTVEEAAPDARKLQHFIRGRLALRGFDCGVETDW